MAIKSLLLDQQTLDISYEIVNPQAEVDFIVLHGWGSNKSLMKQFFAPYMNNFRHIYIDLPGFGNSTCSEALTTQNYATAIDLLLLELDASKDIILGHSFGGKVALLLKPKLLVLVASAGIYIPKPLKIRAKIALFKLLKIFGLAKFREFFVASDAKNLSQAMYETFKSVVDEDFSDKFSNYKGKTLLCWGRDDSATPLSSAKKIEELVDGSLLVVYDGDHYFFMNQAKDITTNIEKIFFKESN